MLSGRLNLCGITTTLKAGLQQIHTDSGDQARRKMAMSERRIERAGQKGMAFVFDIAFSNGAIMQRMLQPADTKIGKRLKTITQR